jgi:sec-independent protein translocase protein TatA
MLSGISWPQLLIVLVIVLAIFGTKKFSNIGADLGKAIKGLMF